MYFHWRLLQLGFCNFRQLSERCLNSWNMMSLKEQFSYFRRTLLKVSRGTYWRHGTLLELKFVTYNFIIPCRKFFQTSILENVTEQILLIVTLIMLFFISGIVTELNPKWRELIEMLPSLLAAREIPLFQFEELCSIEL